jgi:arabinan endo-1,5-alpha-L-arabinosidase
MKILAACAGFGAGFSELQHVRTRGWLWKFKGLLVEHLLRLTDPRSYRLRLCRAASDTRLNENKCPIIIMKNSVLCFLAMTAVMLSFTGCQTTRSLGVPEEPRLLELSGDLAVHDPVIMKENGTYYLFSTGGGRRGGVIPIRCSTNLLHWTRCGSVFETLPAWATNEITRARGAWAPDISWYNGKYHLYYSLSSFGVNESAIGLATSETLDPDEPRYKWKDQGLVIRSRPGMDDFNAIDPNIVVEDKRNVWLSWGSFWGGIMMRRIVLETGKPSANDPQLYRLASRPRSKEHQIPPVEGAIEAPTIVRRGNYWYHFASYDFCCRGTNSTYNVKVGRASKVTGPYLDRTDKPLTEDGGTPVILATSDKWHGAGHQTVFRDNGQDYLLFHSYDPATGQSRLQISMLIWRDGWPRAASE